MWSFYPMQTQGEDYQTTLNSGTQHQYTGWIPDVSTGMSNQMYDYTRTMHTSILKQLHTGWPPTCFGKPCGHPQRYVWIGPDTSLIQPFMYSSFAFCLPEIGHMICRNMYEFIVYISTVEPVYNDIGLFDTSSIASDIKSYQLIPNTFLGYNDIRL
jgi:hypothetical protein